MTPGAKRLLARLGWRFVPSARAEVLRESPREVILAPRLIDALQRHRFEYRGRWHALSPSGIEQVVRELQSLGRARGLLEANERLYRLLTLGVTVTEFMPDGRKHQPTVPLIDWDRPEANHWDMVETPVMPAPRDAPAHTPTAVGWVNGLPLVVIECATATRRGMDEAIDRHLRQQRADAWPPLYAHAHLLLALGRDGARYGTTGTPRRLWARWREPGSAVQPQDEELHLLRALLAPPRLLDLLRHFVLYDRRLGKVLARHAQYFGVHALLARVQQRRPDGAREGGVVWHTTGSGKSLTMVFLTRLLMRHPATRSCRVVVVTDRVDLEDQLARNFLEGGALGAVAGLTQRAEGERARVRSGRELAQRIGHGNERVLFTLVHKFLTAARLPGCYNPSADLVVLVDEGHRSQGGEAHARMRRALPRAAFLAFTGTPLLRHEKTERRFGPILHAHTLQDAVDDGMVTPLLYEERVPELTLDEAAVERWFAQIGNGLSAAQVAALRKRLAHRRAVHGAIGRIELIAWDIAEHFHRHFKATGLGLKGQLATAGKLDAIRYQRLLDATGLVRTAVVMSAPDQREGESALDGGALAEVQRWWAAHVGRQPAQRDAQVLRDFGGPGEPDLLIVVDRLLTGFDEPRNAVLYIDKPLAGHNLIQAVARVNRLHDAKPHGLIVDYRGILRALDTALRDYGALEARAQAGFEAADLQGLVRPWHSEVQRLPALHEALWATLGGRHEPPDLHALRERLRPRPVGDGAGARHDAHRSDRDAFDAALAAFVRCLRTALASRALHEDAGVSAQDIARWKADARRLARLRTLVWRDAAGDAPPMAMRDGLRALLDEAVGGVQVREPTTLYRVGPLLRSPVERAGGRTDATALTPEAPAPDDAPLALLADEPQARHWLDVCRQVLGDAVFGRVPADTWVRLARTTEAAVQRAVAEHSLVREDRDAAIRQALLPPLYALLGLERARRVIDRVVGLVP